MEKFLISQKLILLIISIFCLSGCMEVVGKIVVDSLVHITTPPCELEKKQKKNLPIFQETTI